MEDGTRKRKRALEEVWVRSGEGEQDGGVSEGAAGAGGERGESARDKGVSVSSDALAAGAGQADIEVEGGSKNKSVKKRRRQGAGSAPGNVEPTDHVQAGEHDVLGGCCTCAARGAMREGWGGGATGGIWASVDLTSVGTCWWRCWEGAVGVC
jgi:hypothetical protein